MAFSLQCSIVIRFCEGSLRKGFSEKELYTFCKRTRQIVAMMMVMGESQSSSLPTFINIEYNLICSTNTCREFGFHSPHLLQQIYKVFAFQVLQIMYLFFSFPGTIPEGYIELHICIVPLSVFFRGGYFFFVEHSPFWVFICKNYSKKKKKTCINVYNYSTKTYPEMD